ncbi:hypothetical protein ACHAXT_002232 [Thalassiosira profunda]
MAEPVTQSAARPPPPPPPAAGSPPDAASDDKFDRIYQRYMEELSPPQPAETKGMDPPEERPAWDAGATPAKMAISRHFAAPVPAAASRDDEASQHSHRSCRGQPAMSPAHTREDIYSKLDSLNAKSRTLRVMAYAPPSPGPTSSASVPSANAYSPTSVMSVPKYSRRASDEDIDTRLEYLTRQSLAMRKRMGSSPDSAGQKKVTFESDYVQGSLGHDDKRTFVSQFNDAVPPIASGASTASASSFAPSPSPTTASGRSFAMKVLSEKILDGYSMTRGHCTKCNTALVRNDAAPDGTPAEECVYCPVEELRTSIARKVRKKVIAAKLLSGLEVAPAHGGKSLCDGCHSPFLRNAAGIALECQVCPLLDAACVEMVREEGRGGALQDAECLECGCPEMSTHGATKCVVCEVLGARLGAGYGGQSSEAAWARYSPSWAASKSSASVGGGAPSGALSVVSDGLSQPPGLAASTSIKSSAQPIDLAKIQELKEQLKMELAKARASQQALEAPAARPAHETPALGLGYPASVVESIASGFSRPMSAILVKSPSIMSAESPPVDLSKIEAELKEVLAKADQSQPCHDGDGPDHLTQLQGQLQSELAHAKASQARLEQTLNHSGQDVNTMTRSELQAELEKARQEQFALEQMLKSTKNLEAPASNDPSLSPTEDLLNAAANLRNHSYSISQQEVDATGHAKEYIPPPSYFQQSNVPTEVYVYHIPDDGDDLTAAQSHHTKYLKRSERYPNQNPGIIDCCSGGAAENVHRDAFDYDTIETDDDYSVDMTLNTMDGDDSRLDYVHRSKSSMRDYPTEDERRQERNEGRDSRPNSSIGRFLFSCFGCGDDDDAYTMVSRRGLALEHHPAPHPPRGILRRPSVQRRGMHAPSYHSASMDEDSAYGSMIRVERAPMQRKRLGMSYNAEESEYDSRPRPPKSIGSSPNRQYSRKDATRGGGMSPGRSPSPLFEFDSVVGSEFHRANAVHSPQRTSPADRRRSDYSSVTSDLSDPSAANRRAYQTSYSRPKVESQLRALTEEEETSDMGDTGRTRNSANRRY